MRVLLNPSLIKVSPHYPRKHPHQTHIEIFAESIKSIGITDPIEVYIEDGTYILTHGLRRLLAALYLQLDKVPVEIIEDVPAVRERDLNIFVRFASAINLSPIEEALSIKFLIEVHKFTHKDLAINCGYGETGRLKITRKLKLLSLSPETQELVHLGELSETHGHILSEIEDIAYQIRLANRCVEDELSSRQLRSIIESTPILKKTRTQISSSMLAAEEKLTGIFSSKTKIKMNEDGSVNITISCKDLTEFSTLLNRVDQNLSTIPGPSPI